MMDSHQVEGQRRCTSARPKRLRSVKTRVGRALSPEGGFPARPRIRSLGHERSPEIALHSSQSPAVTDRQPTLALGKCTRLRATFAFRGALLHAPPVKALSTGIGDGDGPLPGAALF